ncbi:MAG: hypothetical protein GEV03_16755 [Streptosporangiales bacterium]|nr:hypothetical protein [Streptosporangiales bacterium]
MANGDRPDRLRLLERLEEIRYRVQKATAWRSATHYMGQLVNRDGYVPVNARLSRDDLTFLAHARDDVLAFVALGQRLLELHQPRDVPGRTSDPTRPMRRCRTCTQRWPCPTYQTIDEVIDSYGY